MSAASFENTTQADDARTHLSVAHECGVFSHQYVGTKEEDESVTETEYSPVQERLEGQQSILADVPAGKRSHFFSKTIKANFCLQFGLWMNK